MYCWEYITHIWFRWHVLNPFSNQLFFFWKYKKFLLSKLRWVRLYLRKGQEHLGFRSIWIWKTKPNIGSQINFLIVLAQKDLFHSLQIWTFWMRVPPHHNKLLGSRTASTFCKPLNAFAISSWIKDCRQILHSHLVFSTFTSLK